MHHLEESYTLFLPCIHADALISCLMIVRSMRLTLRRKWCTTFWAEFSIGKRNRRAGGTYLWRLKSSDATVSAELRADLHWFVTVAANTLSRWHDAKLRFHLRHAAPLLQRTERYFLAIPLKCLHKVDSQQEHSETDEEIPNHALLPRFHPSPLD